MFLNNNPQLNKNGELHHLLSTEGLPAEILRQILDTSQSFVGVTQREVKKVPLLRGKAIFNLFFEPSTRSSGTFFTSRWVTPTNDCEVSSICRRISAGRPSVDNKWCNSPFLLSCGLLLRNIVHRSWLVQCSVCSTSRNLPCPSCSRSMLYCVGISMVVPRNCAAIGSSRPPRSTSAASRMRAGRP